MYTILTQMHIPPSHPLLLLKSFPAKLSLSKYIQFTAITLQKAARQKMLDLRKKTRKQ